ncbi:hypothetical protein LF01B1_06180 [Limosilactobacillus fermentum]|uniref:Uncharacterized protein n=1 Tax=Limosilactobacillus fermentum TaxID=1613 RepID=A0ABD0AK36_LIMFE|nr:hypothetical protein LF01B1_06180 [Limosilactobacillus fermentum]
MKPADLMIHIIGVFSFNRKPRFTQPVDRGDGNSTAGGHAVEYGGHFSQPGLP